MRARRLPASGVLGLALAVLAFRSGASAGYDPAERGMDVYVHAPAEVVSGGVLPLQVRVFGFPTVSTLRPLAGATVEAVWDPESLKAPSPVPVTATCDVGGRASLSVPVPAGEGKLVLLLAARVPGHERTRTLQVTRLRRYAMDLRTSDTSVVPGGALAAWVLISERATGAAVPGAAVDLELKEGTVVRFFQRLVADRSGMASLRVPIPATQDPGWSWTLVARAEPGHGEVIEATRSLGVREEIPRQASMRARWLNDAVAPGAPATFEITVTDATLQAIAGLRLRTWVGQRGVTPPKDDREWLRASKESTTDREGKARVTVATPRTIGPKGSDMTVVARGEHEGRPLEDRAVLALEAPQPSFEVTPELGVLVPGLTQRLFLRARMGPLPLAGEFAVEGHGLAARISTDGRGLGQTIWHVPAEIGARMSDHAPSGCANQVAATVRIRTLSPTRDGKAATEGCVRVDRDAVAVVRPARNLVRAGEALRVQVESTGLRGERSASVVALDGQLAAGTWLADARRGGTITLPEGASGLWSLVAHGMDAGKADVIAGSVLVLPRILPRLVARRIDGRATPGGSAVVEATLDDGHGRPLAGSVSAVVFDKYGGSHAERLLALDTRRTLAAAVDVNAQDMDAFLEGDARLEDERSLAMARVHARSLAPALDPAANVREQIDQTFARIVNSLESAIHEASNSPETLRDVRLKVGHGHAINPELLTQVTAGMDEPPSTPGGETWRLSDLIAIDPQVRYDLVAQRVTRLKLFNVLAHLREYMFSEQIDRDEPVLRDPNALLRRLLRQEHGLSTGDLLDPWGRGMAFVRDAGPRLPFLTVVPGHRLVSAGPDGRFGTADDVRDPFQRVLTSNTPYARAVQEDRLVDARLDMRVGEATVQAWKSLLEELTGEGNLIGDGSGGGGTGEGTIGLGSFGTIGRGGGGRGDPGPAEWLAPVRTDEQGRVRLTVPLGPHETTWQIVLVAMPDSGTPATAEVEVPMELPLSATIATGDAWIVGDEVDTLITLHNRTQAPLATRVDVTVSGAAALVRLDEKTRTIMVPALATVTTHARVRGAQAGKGALDVALRAAEHADHLHHEWRIEPAGEVFDAVTSAWLDKQSTLAVAKATADSPAVGDARLVLERGLAPTFSAVLDSLEPDELHGIESLADAAEVVQRVRDWAVARGGDGDPLAVRARELARRILARADATLERHDAAAIARWQRQAALLDQSHGRMVAERCPPSGDLALAQALPWLENAPAARAGVEKACWSSLLASTMQKLAQTSDAVVLARAVLSLHGWKSQAAVVDSLVQRLALAAPLRSDGTLVLPEAQATDPRARVLVLSAYLQSRRIGIARLLLERQARGFGSTEATRVATRVLQEGDSRPAQGARLTWAALGDAGRELGRGQLEIGAGAPGQGGRQTVALPHGTVAVRAESSAPGVLLRIERPLYRSFLRPFDQGSPAHIELSLPSAPRAGSIGTLRVRVRHEIGDAVAVAARIPLPPGAVLAERVTDVRQVQGALHVRMRLGADALARTVDIPLRFSLSGTVLLPEATLRVADRDLPLARAVARPIVIAARP